MEQSLVRQACWLEVTLNEKLLTRWPVVGVDFDLPEYRSVLV
jgi:hypothetical protein